jgi:hypothetical protein
MEVTLQNTSRGQVQKIKYFASTDRTSTVESREENIESSMDTGQAYTEFADQCGDSVPLHRKTKGKVRQNCFRLPHHSKEIDTE